MTTGLEPALSFGSLVTGGGNQLALAAARAIAESPSPPFNPLFLFGEPGLGKTHLLHAIGHRKLEVAPRAVVRVIGWAELSEGWRAAVAIGRAEAFLSPWREADLLLIDDVHLLEERSAGRAELLGLVDARIAHRRPTVLAGRRAPSDLFTPDDPAGRSLGTGLVVECTAPDSAMRWEILHQRSEDAGVELAPAVLEEIAGLRFDSIRDLVGAVNRLLAFQSVSPTPLDPAQARVLITGVIEEVAPDTGVPVETEPGGRPSPAPRPSPIEEPDEFGSFLSEVVASVSQQVDEWRSRIADALLRWQGEGYHTARLEALLDQELPAQPEVVLRRFESDIETLQRLEAEVREIAPDLASAAAFRDPDQVAMAEQLVEQARTQDLDASLPVPHLRLDGLVEGTSNHLVLEAVRAAATAPGTGPNPLFIVAESGVGKTHLLHGLGNALVDAVHRGVVCIHAHTLCDQVQTAADTDQLAAWRQRFRWASALLVDDVHLLAGHPVAQEELSALIDQMLESGRQSAFTSAVPVAELTGLSPQLLSRLASGLVVDLPRPDREVRLGIVRQLLTGSEASGDAALTDYLASRPVESVRGLHALVQRLLRAAEAGQIQPSHALARQALEMPAARLPVRPGPARPGVLGPTLGGSRLREKLVDQWPVVTDRLVEELR
jgi:chromosomal replication initiation ATPase DnaA